jgi:hypothetical protein
MTFSKGVKKVSLSLTQILEHKIMEVLNNVQLEGRQCVKFLK